MIGSSKQNKNLDRKLVALLGRFPVCIILCTIFGAITEMAMDVVQYVLDFTDMYELFDNLVYVLGPKFAAVALAGAVGGLFVGAIAGAVTDRISNRLIRAFAGIVAGIAARSIAELVMKSITQGKMEYAFSYLQIFFDQIVIAGSIVGLYAGLIPFPDEKKPAALNNPE
jgi:hypothetical protein